MEQSNAEYGVKRSNSLLVQNGNKTMEGFSSDTGNHDHTVDDVYRELIHLRQRNRGLENRINQLEKTNFNITAHKGTFKSQSKGREPTRPIFNNQNGPNQDFLPGTADR
jgi:hypothetical protein